MKTEDDPLDPDAGARDARERRRHAPPRPRGDGGRRHRAALRRLLRRGERRDGRAGPQAACSRSSATAAASCSFIHLDDAAAATVLALDHDGAGDLQHRRRRARARREWLPVLAEVLGAKPPRHVPRWLAKLVAGEAAVMLGTDVARRVEREGPARAGLGAAVPELAPGVRGGLRGRPGSVSPPARGRLTRRGASSATDRRGTRRRRSRRRSRPAGRRRGRRRRRIRRRPPSRPGR